MLGRHTETAPRFNIENNEAHAYPGMDLTMVKQTAKGFAKKYKEYGKAEEPGQATLGEGGFAKRYHGHYRMRSILVSGCASIT